MKLTLISLALLSIFSCSSTKSMQPDNTPDPMNPEIPDTSNQLTYLALGDSYTIGEGVSESGRYPNQLLARLNAENPKSWAEAKIIAQTGWTVDELDRGINAQSIEGEIYDLVTLSIGVNNQYRGLAVEDYQKDFEQMLLRAIQFAGINSNHVVVLSIPDWGITPFADQSGRDQNQIAAEIDAYNQAKKEICEKHEVKYIDITAQYRSVGARPEMLAADGLHPSAELYKLWTEKLYEHIQTLNF
ncbi:SGNH/GDSL hydrolase family protein [Algoriphagus halophytocola]|uniref:SGNH/GDSL hydrolase family protein n=1 Tax=Algoriphagus halophytocola TaxID=2991499 RepID=A0ABY6MK25_9BACT|nr:MULTISPECIES: SGNH/GDSL hydrolase family protein [unclassified Algoriphagus]UZD23309.1 SGNH/GDSL hydrolase family protein [Algoriphagus sp. TR-M5]WBL44604.1 SGNH/GDSL hydrolase family protein [Algoriphagus sp. TR-M9]